MTKMKDQPKANAAALSEEELGGVRGGYANLEVSHLKGKKAGILTFLDARQRGGAGFLDEDDA